MCHYTWPNLEFFCTENFVHDIYFVILTLALVTLGHSTLQTIQILRPQTAVGQSRELGKLLKIVKMRALVSVFVFV